MIGLANVGNTCYLNSAIQALRFSRPIANLFSTDAWRRYEHPDRKEHTLATATAGLLAEMSTTTSKPWCIPIPFARAFIAYARDFSCYFSHGSQADSAEAVQILLDALHTYLAREVHMTVRGDPTLPEEKELVAAYNSWTGFFRKEYSALSDAFYGQTQTRVRCTGCGATSTRYEPWSILKLPIPGGNTNGSVAPTLDDCLTAALADDAIEDYACDACSTRGPARLEHAISRFPDQLILCIKRFTNTGQKIRGRIVYDPDCINLSAHCAWPTLQDPAEATYIVRSTIEHLGTSHSGHYCMRTRASDSWYLVDDVRVQVFGPGGIASADTYMLFLERAEKKHSD